MNNFNILSAKKKMRVNELKDVIYENYYERIGFKKESTYYSFKHQKRAKKLKFIELKRNTKVTKLLHSHASSASTYNVEILSSFNRELQLDCTFCCCCFFKLLPEKKY